MYCALVGAPTRRIGDTGATFCHAFLDQRSYYGRRNIDLIFENFEELASFQTPPITLHAFTNVDSPFALVYTGNYVSKGVFNMSVLPSS